MKFTQDFERLSKGRIVIDNVHNGPLAFRAPVESCGQAPILPFFVIGPSLALMYLKMLTEKLPLPVLLFLK